MTTQIPAGASGTAQKGIESSGRPPAPQWVATSSGSRPAAARGSATRAAGTPAVQAAALHHTPRFRFPPPFTAAS